MDDPYCIFPIEGIEVGKGCIESDEIGMVTTSNQTTATTTTTTTTDNRGSGILCYTLAPSSNEIYFLLGREIITNPHNHFVRKSWSDFSGRMESMESIEENAAREFFEESMGMIWFHDEGCESAILGLQMEEEEGVVVEQEEQEEVDTEKSDDEDYGEEIDVYSDLTLQYDLYNNNNNNHHPPLQFEDRDQNQEERWYYPKDQIDRISSLLQSNCYTFKIEIGPNLEIGSDTPRRYRTTFVKQIAWDPEIVIRFSKMREMLLEVSNMAEDIKKMIADEREMEGLLLLSERGLVGDDGGGDDVDVLKGGEEEVAVVVAQPVYLQTTTIDVVNLEPGEQQDVYEFVPPPIFEEKWDEILLNQKKDHQKSFLIENDIVDHPAIYYDPTLDIFQVKKEYLEKDCIELWSMDRLMDVIKSGGSFRKEHLRLSFIPTLAVVMDLFTKKKERDRMVDQQQFDYDDYYPYGQMDGLNDEQENLLYNIICLSSYVPSSSPPGSLLPEVYPSQVHETEIYTPLPPL